MASLHDEALSYARAGMRVFPLIPGTKVPPRGFGWKDMASSNVDVVSRWWDHTPEAGIAKVCGPSSGSITMDFDGELGMRMAGDLVGDLERLRYGATPGAGAHLHAVCNEVTAGFGNRSVKGLDIQGNDSAYVVMPPSVLTWEAQLAVMDAERRAKAEAGLIKVSVGPYHWEGYGSDWVWTLDADHGRIVHGWLGDEGEGGVWLGELPDSGVVVPVSMGGHVGTFMASGACTHWDGDRSRALLAVATALMGSGGLDEAQTLAVMVANEWCARPALERRGGPERAREWLWQYVVCKARAGVVTAEEAFAGVVAGQVGPIEAVVTEEETAAIGLEYAAQNLTPGDWRGIADWVADLAHADMTQTQRGGLLRVAAAAAKVGLEGLKADLKQAEAKVARQAGEAQALLMAGSPLVRDYVMVESQGKLFNRRTRDWVSVPAFAHMYGAQAAKDYVQGGILTRYISCTYAPRNPWALGFEYAEAMEDVEAGAQVLNLWVPPRIEPRWGEDVGPWLRHLDWLGLVGEVREHLLNHMAFTAQHPEVKVNHMVVLGGIGGCGKGLALAPMWAALGETNVFTTTHAVMGSDFDPDISGAKLLVIEELADSEWGKVEAKKLYNKMKPYGAAPPNRLPVVLKNANQMLIPNVVAVYGQTNYRNAVALDPDDRRCFMAWCTGGVLPVEMAQRLGEWMEDGGDRAVAGWLLKRDVRGWAPKAAPPKTEWWHESVATSKSELAALLSEVVYGRAWPDVVPIDELVSAVRIHAMEKGEKADVTAQRVGMTLGQIGAVSRRVGRHKDTVVILRNHALWTEAPGGRVLLTARLLS